MPVFKQKLKPNFFPTELPPCSFLGFANERWELPWASCDNWWNSADCLSILDVNKRVNGTVGTKDSVVEYWE